VTARIKTRVRGLDVVLLHGYALHSGIWGPWLTPLSEHAELHPVDLPGHGGRPWTSEIRTLEALAHAVADQAPPGAIIIGWSLGGMVALELARQAPANLRGLVLLATTPRFATGEDWPHGIDPGTLEEFGRGLVGDYDRTVRDFLALQVHGAADPHSTLRQLRAGLRGQPAPDPRALAAGLEILRRSDLRCALPAIEVPALVIAGTHDRLTMPGAGDYLAQALPMARLRRIDGAGHAPFLSHPAAVLAEVTAFMAELESAPHRAAPVGA
jgi:pimeloyl-[acyl-carrier protein] methyl ester esterase